MENERQARARSDRSKTELQQEIDDLSDQLGQQGGATVSQMEMNKKKDNELAKLRREIEQLNMNFESQSTALKKKGQDLTLELTEQIEQVMRTRNRADKERAHLQKQLDEAVSRSSLCQQNSTLAIFRITRSMTRPSSASSLSATPSRSKRSWLSFA